MTAYFILVVAIPMAQMIAMIWALWGRFDDETKGYDDTEYRRRK